MNLTTVRGLMSTPVEDPERCAILAIIAQAVRDWQRYHAVSGLSFDMQKRIDLAGRRGGIVPHREELLSFFKGRHFEGLCEWADIEPQTIRELWGV